MSLQGERIRQAIDRKQWVITALLQALGFIRRELSNEDEGLEKGGPPPPYKFCTFSQNEATEVIYHQQDNLKNEAKRSYRNSAASMLT